MKKVSLILVPLLILILISTAYAANWLLVTSFTGASDQTTNYFDIPSNEWRIVWSITPDHDYPQYAIFGFFAFPKGEDVMYVGSLSTDSSQTSGTIYIHEGSKEYYLQIISGNLDAYKLRIEYDAPASPTSPTSPSGTPNTINGIIGGLTLFSIAVLVIFIIIFMRRRKNPQIQETRLQSEPNPPNLAQNSLGSDISERLKKLKGLLDKDLISQEEYNKRKSEILSQL